MYKLILSWQNVRSLFCVKFRVFSLFNATIWKKFEWKVKSNSQYLCCKTFPDDKKINKSEHIFEWVYITVSSPLAQSTYHSLVLGFYDDQYSSFCEHKLFASSTNLPGFLFNVYEMWHIMEDKNVF